MRVVLSIYLAILFDKLNFIGDSSIATLVVLEESPDPMFCSALN